MGKTKKKAKPKARLKKIKAAKALLQQAPAAVEEVRATLVADISQAKGEDIPEGLVEVECMNTHLKLLGMQDQSAIPTMEQRLAMARRLNEIGPKLPRYVKKVMNERKGSTTSIGDADMGKGKIAIPGTDLTVKDIEKAHALSVKEAEEREKTQKKEAAKKAKEDEERRKKDSAMRKKMKTMDLTPTKSSNQKTAGGHNWVKQNLVSNKDGSDDYMCENEGCEKKFKRRGLGWNAPAGDCKGKTSASAQGGPLDVSRFKGKAKGKKTGKDANPTAQVRGISAPPVKKKAGMEPTKVPAGGFTKDSKPATSGELIRARIGEHKMTDDAIAAEVRKLWPGRTTAVSDVRWNRSQMEKAGVKNVPEPVEGSTVPGKRK